MNAKQTEVLAMDAKMLAALICENPDVDGAELRILAQRGKRSREKACPWLPDERKAFERATLHVGDYAVTVKSLYSLFHIRQSQVDDAICAAIFDVMSVGYTS